MARGLFKGSRFLLGALGCVSASLLFTAAATPSLDFAVSASTVQANSLSAAKASSALMANLKSGRSVLNVTQDSLNTMLAPLTVPGSDPDVVLNALFSLVNLLKATGNYLEAIDVNLLQYMSNLSSSLTAAQVYNDFVQICNFVGCDPLTMQVNSNTSSLQAQLNLLMSMIPHSISIAYPSGLGADQSATASLTVSLACDSTKEPSIINIPVAQTQNMPSEDSVDQGGGVIANQLVDMYNQAIDYILSHGKLVLDTTSMSYLSTIGLYGESYSFVPSPNLSTLFILSMLNQQQNLMNNKLVAYAQLANPANLGTIATALRGINLSFKNWDQLLNCGVTAVKPDQISFNDIVLISACVNQLLVQSWAGLVPDKPFNADMLLIEMQAAFNAWLPASVIAMLYQALQISNFWGAICQSLTHTNVDGSPLTAGDSGVRILRLPMAVNLYMPTQPPVKKGPGPKVKKLQPLVRKGSGAVKQ